MKTLSEKMNEVYAVNVEKGWFETERTFGEGIALLHSEVSEALDAYRDHGIADATKSLLPGMPNHVLAKPEGVGSEFADVLIRILDMCKRYDVDPDDALKATSEFPLPYCSFGEDLAVLHYWIALLVIAVDHRALTYQIGVILDGLRQLCTSYNIDLEAEYERKIAFNRTRAHRHGGRAL